MAAGAAARARCKSEDRGRQPAVGRGYYESARRFAGTLISAEIPRLAPQSLAREHRRVAITHHDRLLAVGQIDLHDRTRHRNQSPKSSQSRVAAAVTPDTPLTMLTNVLLLRWDTKPAAHPGDVPTSCIDT